MVVTDECNAEKRQPETGLPSFEVQNDPEDAVVSTGTVGEPLGECDF